MTRDAYNQIEQVLERLMASSDPSVSLSVLASDLGLSEGYFQRLFTEWAGVSPKKFQQFLTLEAAKERLQASESVLDASLDAGLSGPGRLHDLMVSLEAMSPGEYKDGGAGLQIRFGELSTPFGMATIFRTYRGICALEFLSMSHALEQVQQRWPNADFVTDPESGQSLSEQIFQTSKLVPEKPLALHVKGTRFQVQVWKALLSIPQGQVSTYGSVAEAIGRDRRASRAIGNAVGANRIGWLIPCHRVIRRSGLFGAYRWGAQRKMAMLGWEASHQARP